MQKRSGSRRRKIRSVICLLVLSMGAIVAANRSASHAQDQTATQKRGNLQVLKGMPDADLFEVMNAVGDSLGVDCSYCHVKGDPDPKTRENNWFWALDDKPEKLRGREMMKMVVELN